MKRCNYPFHHSLPIEVFPVKVRTGSSMRLNQQGSTEISNYKKEIRFCFVYFRLESVAFKTSLQTTCYSFKHENLSDRRKHALFIKHPSFHLLIWLHFLTCQGNCMCVEERRKGSDTFNGHL